MRQKAGQSALIVFLRLPEKGKVKTRIAESLGEEEALSIYKELVATTLETSSNLSCTVYLYFDPDLPVETERLTGFIYRAQVSGNLGVKMAHAFADVLQDHHTVVLIGSDCPYLTTNMIQQSLDALDNCDIVLGPAADGGYYLLGCHAVHPSLFEHIAWGTNAVLYETLRQIRERSLTYTLLETLHDIDTADDWTHYLGIKK